MNDRFAIVSPLPKATFSRVLTTFSSREIPWIASCCEHRNVLADSMQDDDDEFLVLTLGAPSPAWTNMPPTKKQGAIAFTYSQRFGEDAKDRCLNDSVLSFLKQLKTKEKNMTIQKWFGAFTDAISSSSRLCASGFGRQLRALGSDLALSSHHSLFMAREWIGARYLRPRLTSMSGSELSQSSVLSGCIPTLCSRKPNRICTCSTTTLATL